MSIFLAIMNFVWCFLTLFAALTQNDKKSTLEKIGWVILTLTFFSNSVYMVIMS